MSLSYHPSHDRSEVIEKRRSVIRNRHFQIAARPRLLQTCGCDILALSRKLLSEAESLPQLGLSQMHESKVWLFASAGALTIALACHEVDGPMARSIQAPGRVSKIMGPPAPQTYTLSSAGLSAVELTGNNYPYSTWIAVVPNGPTFMLTAYPPALPASGQVGATGASGGRNGCDLNAKVGFGQIWSGFGLCGGAVGNDTVLAQGQGFIRQGSMPLDYASPDNSDCPPHTYGTCHTQEIVNTTFTVSPIPATMVPVKSVPRAVPFNSVDYQQVTFTTGPNPAQILIGGALSAVPMTTTSWVYTAGDGTLDGNMCAGGYPVVACSPYLHKAGRMVVKGFVGGWEQTSTITVQCLVTPADTVLNDSTSDFNERGAILNMLLRSKSDSSPYAGFDVSHPGWDGGWTHETTILVWKLPNGEGFETDTLPTSYSNACEYAATIPPPPVPGATLISMGHDHPLKAGDPQFCRGTVRKNGVDLPRAERPADTLSRPYTLEPRDSTAADSVDRQQADDFHMPIYVLTQGGVVMRISPAPDLSYPNTQTLYRAFGATSPAESKCTWVKNYP